MALTKNIKHTGRAAVTERADFAAYLYEQQEQERRRKHRFSVEWKWNLRRLVRIDPDWEAWYDARPEQTKKEMLPLIKARIEELFKIEFWTMTFDGVGNSSNTEWSEPSEEYKNSQPYHNDLYPYF